MAGASKNLIGKQVRRLRMEANLSQEAFAAKCQRLGWDLSREMLSKIEAGIRRIIDAELVLIADALGCQIQDLIGKVGKTRLLDVARHGRDS